MTTEQKIFAAEQKLMQSGAFERIDRIAFENQKKVMAAFRKHQVSDSHFCSSSGYGYDDKGRETLDKIYAEVFESEAAFVRHSIISGTQTLCIGLFGLLRPGDTMFSVTGKPYDTLEEVIGIRGEAGNGSLKDYGVNYKQLEMKDGEINIPEMVEFLKSDKSVKVVFIQRSKGYAVRKTLSAEEIGVAAKAAHEVNPDVFVIVDNCYGEFCDEHEPTYYGADMIMGSLIKNPGGGMAETGGYIAGTKKAVELCSYRMTTPGIGREVGATLGNTRDIFMGLFSAPHVTGEALKTAVFTASLFEEMGYEVSPKPNETRADIIQSIKLETPEKLVAFCQGLQSGSAIDSFVVPEPWAMPGYQDEVIMAAGAFTNGSSIELSADAPLREPYAVWLQGAFNFHSGKLGIMLAAENVLNLK